MKKMNMKFHEEKTFKAEQFLHFYFLLFFMKILIIVIFLYRKMGLFVAFFFLL